MVSLHELTAEGRGYVGLSFVCGSAFLISNLGFRLYTQTVML